VLAPAAETTEKVHAERQLRVLREFGLHTANEKTPELACLFARLGNSGFVRVADRKRFVSECAAAGHETLTLT